MADVVRIADVFATAWRRIDAVPDGAKLVMVDNLYGYGPGASPISETSPQNATDTKGRVRRSMAQTLEKTHRAGRIRVHEERLHLVAVRHE